MLTWIWMKFRFAALTAVIGHLSLVIGKLLKVRSLVSSHWSLVAAWLHGVIGMLGWRSFGK